MDETRYVEVDIDKLSSVLAEDNWMKITANIDSKDLYETTVMLDGNSNTGEIVKTVRSYWQTTFFALKSGYESLILNYSRHDNKTECSTDRPEGTDQ